MKSIFFTLAFIEIACAIFMTGCSRIPSEMHMNFEVDIGDEKPT